MSEEITKWKLETATKALQMAYRKHHLDDESIGWSELGDRLCDALCELMGDKEFVRWNESQPDPAK